MQDQDYDNTYNLHHEQLASLYAVRKEYFEKEVYESILKSIGDINKKVLASKFLTMKMPNLIGCTALFFVIERSHVTLLDLLLEKGIDFCIKSSKDTTVVHEELYHLIHSSDKSSRFINSILDAHVDSNNSQNPCDNNGLSHFHAACVANRMKAIEFFLKNEVSCNQAIHKDSPILPGFTPLHITAKYRYVEAAEILLKNNANKYSKDARGMSCLHTLVEERLKYSFHESMLKRLKNDKTTFAVYSSNNQKIIELMLGETCTWNPNETDDIGLSLFHVACTLKDISLIENLIRKLSNIKQAVNVDSPIWSGYTALHFAAHFELETVKLLIKNGADLEIADTEGLTPFEICLQRYTAEEVCSILKLRTDWENILFSDGKTKLYDFIQAMRDMDEFEKFLTDKVANINMFISLESGIAAGCTPLHLAVIATGIAKTNLKVYEDADYQAPYDIYEDDNETETITYYFRIRCCRDLGADISIQDRRGMTPLHHSFYLHEYYATSSILLEDQDKTVNSVDINGISHFHIACILTETEYIKKLLSISEGKETINDLSTSIYTPKNEVQNSVELNKGSTSLHIAVATENLELIKMLMEHKINMSIKDSKGLSPLDLAIVLHKKDRIHAYIMYDSLPISYRIIELLIKYEVNAIACKYDSYIPLKQILYKCNIFARVLLVLELERQNVIQRCILQDMGITMLHIASAFGDIDKIKQLLDKGANVNAQVYLDSPVWPGCTPLNILISKNLNNSSVEIELVELLLNYGADVTIANSDLFTPIHAGYELLQYGDDKHDLGSVFYKKGKFHSSSYYELLIESHKNFRIDPVSIRGMSHFHVACALNKVEIVKQFLDHRVDHRKKINCFAEDFAGYSALHFAVHFEAKDTIDLLLKHGADINCKDVLGNNSLHIFAQYSSSRLDILESLLRSDDVNINALNLTGETILEVLLQSNRSTPQAIDILIKRGCIFNDYNAITKQGYLALLVNHNRKDIIQTVLSVLNNIEINDKDSTFVHNLVSIIKHNGMHLGEFSIEMTYRSIESYCSAICLLKSQGVDINQQDNQGLTALHVAAQRRNLPGIKGLLMNGADINITDKLGKSVFSYSMEVANNSLINTRVDYEILTMLLTHIYKLKALYLELTAQNLNFYSELVESDSESLIELLNNEIAKMQDEKWRTCLPSLALESFLHEISPIKYSIMSKQNRDIVDEFFKSNVLILRENFPELSSILLLQYEKARARLNLIEMANNCLSSVVGVQVPLLCAREIFMFLSNTDLKNLIISSSLE